MRHRHLLYATLAALLSAVALFSAPAPAPEPPPGPAAARAKAAAPAVTAGAHTLVFAGTRAPMRLAKDGNYECDWCGAFWYGSWAFCPLSRVFTIHETTDGRSWLQHVVTLDAALSGTTAGGTAIAVEPGTGNGGAGNGGGGGGAAPAR